MRLAPQFRIFRNHTRAIIDVKEDLSDLTELVEIVGAEPFILHPGEFVLGSTLERVKVPEGSWLLASKVRAALGRLGLLIHSTAGFVDAGWNGQLTLELSNVASLPITLYPGHEDRPDELHADDHSRPTTRTVQTRSAPSIRTSTGPIASRYNENF